MGGGFLSLQMSEQQLKAFLEAVKADAALQEKLKAAGDADAVVAIAKAAGFMISSEDLKNNAVTEISAEELEGAAGGYDWKEFHYKTAIRIDPALIAKLE